MKLVFRIGIIVFIALSFTCCEGNGQTNTKKDYSTSEADSYLAKYKTAEGFDLTNCSDEEINNVFDHLLVYANNGHVESMHELAFMYQWGIGNEKDYDKAFYWYQKASDLGYLPSMKEMATAYSMGKNDWYCNLPRNFHKAEKILLALANNGNIDALNDLGYLYHMGCSKDDKYVETEDDFPADLNKALAVYSEAASKGNAYAMYQLGELFKDGFHDAEKALEWYDEAIEHGSYDAAKSLGYLYFFGDENFGNFPVHVDVDYKKALEYFNISLELSDNEYDADEAKEHIAETYYYLGRQYEYGLDCKSDKSEAIKWYRLAAESGYEEAKERLEVLTR